MAAFCHRAVRAGPLGDRRGVRPGETGEGRLAGDNWSGKVSYIFNTREHSRRNRGARYGVGPVMTELGWTNSGKLCDPAEVSVTDPMLVVRRHVDLLRVRSAICRPGR